MKHLASPVQGASETKVKVPTRRALAKLQTRAKVLAAARQLFSEQGYEGATIRDIALAAGMSTGAVFASFADKSDLFREIMRADIEAVADAMGEAAGAGRSVEDSILKVFMAGYAYYKDQLPLVRAALSFSWVDEDEGVCRNILPAEGLLALLTEQLVQGIARGELAKDSELKLRTEMLFDCYLSNFQRAIYGRWGLEALQARSREQIAVILAGAKAG